MPQLPEDIIDRLTQMERRIQQLSTAVNTRPPQNTVTSGGVEITDGGYLAVRPPTGGSAVFAVGRWSGDEYGLAVRRQTGATALTLYNGDGTSTSQQPLRIYDVQGHEVFSDDIDTGGLARPWLPLVPPRDTATARWPQTTSTSWTTVAHSYNPLWQPRMRLFALTATSSGAAGNVRVLVNGAVWGSSVSAGTAFDHTGPVTSDFDSDFASLLSVEIQCQVTSSSGTVYAQPQMMFGMQTS